MKLDLSRASILSVLAVTVVAQACGGDDNGGKKSSNSTTSTATSAGTGNNTSNVDTATSSGTSNTTGSSTSGNTSGGGSGGTGSSTTGDSTTGTGGSAGETSTMDTSTTGEGGGAGDVGTTGEGGAGGAMVSCDPPFEEGTVSEGGAAPFSAMLVDDYGESNSDEQWNIWPHDDAAGGLLTASVAHDAMEGVSCAGALQVDLPWDQYANGQQARLEHDLGAVDWTGATMLHLSIRFADPGTGNLDHIAWGDLFFRTGGWNIWSSQSLNFGELADFEWHEITVDLTTVTATPDLGVVNSLGVELGLPSTAPGTGPATPPATTFYVDDIWVE